MSSYRQYFCFVKISTGSYYRGTELGPLPLAPHYFLGFLKMWLFLCRKIAGGMRLLNTWNLFENTQPFTITWSNKQTSSLLLGKSNVGISFLADTAAIEMIFFQHHNGYFWKFCWNVYQALGVRVQTPTEKIRSAVIIGLGMRRIFFWKMKGYKG